APAALARHGPRVPPAPAEVARAQGKAAGAARRAVPAAGARQHLRSVSPGPFPYPRLPGLRGGKGEFVLTRSRGTAQMLAAPPRYCSITRARLPRSFLQPFRPVTNPFLKIAWWTPTGAVPEEYARDT